jgi:Methyltransferase domain
VADRIELIEGDARSTLEDVPGPIDLLFVDAAKDRYGGYIEAAEPKLSDRAALVVDNMLMSGEVALPADAGTGSPNGKIAFQRWNGSDLSASRKTIDCGREGAGGSRRQSFAAISFFRARTRSARTSSGRGLSGEKRIVPFDTSKPARRSSTASTAAGLNGNTLRCFFAALNPSSGRPA